MECKQEGSKWLENAQAVEGGHEPVPTVCRHVEMQASVSFFLKRLLFQQFPKGKMFVSTIPIFQYGGGVGVSAVQVIQIRRGTNGMLFYGPDVCL